MNVLLFDALSKVHSPVLNRGKFTNESATKMDYLVQYSRLLQDSKCNICQILAVVLAFHETESQETVGDDEIAVGVAHREVS
jgi:hypothetical protein